MFASTLFVAVAMLAFPSTDSQIKLSQKRLGSKCVVEKTLGESDQEMKYEGIVIQITDKIISLDDVTKIGDGNRGVPFLSGVPYNNGLFKNAGAREEKLDVRVIIKTQRNERITFTKVLNANSKDPFVTLKNGSRIAIDGIPNGESMNFKVAETIERNGRTKIELEKADH